MPLRASIVMLTLMVRDKELDIALWTRPFLLNGAPAQWLLQQAWEETLKTQQPTKPWPWADTWPVGRLIVPRLGINQIILADASGRSLAFGPGLVGNGIFPEDENESLIVSGHRDTHFSFLRDVQPEEIINLQTVQGDWFRYVVEETAVLDSQTD